MLLGGGRHGGAEVAGGARAWRPRGVRDGAGQARRCRGGLPGAGRGSPPWRGSASGIAGQVAVGLCCEQESRGEGDEREGRERRPMMFE